MPSLPSGARSAALGVVAELGAGIALLGRGFALWARRPGLMALGLLPALLVGIVLLAALTALVANAPALVAWATPFAEGWPELGRGLLRLLIAIATVVAGALLAIATFTGASLAVGEPVYDRIWRATEEELGGAPSGHGLGFWRGVGEGLLLVLRAAAVAPVLWLVGLLPVVGTVAAAVLGFVYGGRLMATELASRALAARGYDLAARRALIRTRQARVFGFGIAVQLCFLVPGGAVLVMPAAVAGATRLARSLLPAESDGDAPGG